MNILKYLKDVRAESKNIMWPTRKTTTFFTIAVIVISLITIVYMGVLDNIFISIVKEWLLK